VDKKDRLELANKAIEIVASHGRKFFSLHADGGNPSKPNRISKFEFREGRLWFVDKYTQKAIYVAYRRGRWAGFSEGGTLRDLVEALADWIVGKRKEFPLNHFGPFPLWACGGDPWAYGFDMHVVREDVGRLLCRRCLGTGWAPHLEPMGALLQEVPDVKVLCYCEYGEKVRI
jgi:hypothetical protein